MNRRILAIAFAAALAACGSSNKSSGPTAAHNVTYAGPTGAVAIASTSAATVASGAYSGLSGVSSFNNFTSVMGVQAAPAFTAFDAARLPSRFAPMLVAAQVSGATQSGSQKCNVSGSMSGSITAVDTDYPFTHTGDSASITFSLCDNGGGEVLDGSISIRIDSTVAGTDFLGADPAAIAAGATYAATLTFGDLTVATSGGAWTGMDGNITLSVSKRVTPYYELEESLSGTGLAYATGQGAHILEGSLLAGPSGSDPYLQKLVARYQDGTFYTELGEYTTVNGKMCSTAMGGCLTVVTVTPIYDPTGASHPTAGLLVMRSGNAELIFDVLSATSVDVGWDDNVTVDPTPAGTIHATWACLDAGTCH